MTGDVERIGVVGAGQMGVGIAQTCAMHGLPVRLADETLALAGAGKDVIARSLARLVDREEFTAEAATAALENITPTEMLSDLADCDFVMEAVSEDEHVKRMVYGQLADVLAPTAILATNTSSLSITRLAAATKHPERFLGVHFMIPAPRMRLVEMIRGMQTEPQTFERAVTFVKSLGKDVATSEDSPAFIVNRVLIPMINEAAYALYEGVGTVESIDAAMRLGANHPMGPFELADFVGLDTCAAILRVLYEELGAPKYKPCPLLTKYVDAGWLGRKTGRGFYDYRGDSPAPTR